MLFPPIYSGKNTMMKMQEEEIQIVEAGAM
jgi:hypothetical protein